MGGDHGSHGKLVFGEGAVEAVQAHHAREPDGSSRAHRCPGEQHATGFVGRHQSPGLGVADGDEVLAMSLEPCQSKRQSEMQPFANLQLVSFQVLTSTAVQSIVVAAVLGVSV